VTLVNRGKARGELAVKLLGLPFVPLSDFQATHFSLLVNATPVGRDDNAMPFEVNTLSRGTLVIDLVYGARPTPLMDAVIARGGAIIDGYDVLLSQVRKQFQMMTGLEMPVTIGRQSIAPRAFGNFVSAEAESQNGRPPLSRVKEPALIQITGLLQTRMNVAKA